MNTSGNVSVTVAPAPVNLTPQVFHAWGRQYFTCFEKLGIPAEYSPVPYFLLCRAIELAIKAMHLQVDPQKDVKNLFKHNLEKSYRALPPHFKTLNAVETQVLIAVGAMYRAKEFEYFSMEQLSGDAATLPNLAVLECAARRLLVLTPNHGLHNSSCERMVVIGC